MKNIVHFYSQTTQIQFESQDDIYVKLSEIINNIKNITTITTTDEGQINIKEINIEYNNNDDDSKKLIFEEGQKQAMYKDINYGFNLLKDIKNHTELNKKTSSE